MPIANLLPIGPGLAQEWRDPGGYGPPYSMLSDFGLGYLYQWEQGKRFSLEFQKLPANADTVEWVEVMAMQAGDDVGIAQLLLFADSVEALVTTFPAAQGAYFPHVNRWLLTPAGHTWTPALVNTLRAGLYTLTEADQNNAHSVDFMRLTVQYTELVTDHAVFSTVEAHHETHAAIVTPTMQARPFDVTASRHVWLGDVELGD